MNERELVKHARAGDPRAFRELMAIHHDACWRYARRVLDEPDDADDVLQEVLFRASRALHDYRDDGRFRGWLFAIVVNQCRMANRAARRRARRFTNWGDAEVADSAAQTPTPEVNVGDIDLERAVSRLDAAQREAIFLRYGEDMDYKDMALITGMAESALRMRVMRACRALREALAPSREVGG